MTDTENGTRAKHRRTVEVPVDGDSSSTKTRATGVPVQRHASLHEKAVQAVASGEVTIGEYKKPRAARKQRKQPLDYHIQPCDVLKTYIEETLDSTENSYTKAKVTSPETAILR